VEKGVRGGASVQIMLAIFRTSTIVTVQNAVELALPKKSFLKDINIFCEVNSNIY
jgi:hypothetical protein